MGHLNYVAPTKRGKYQVAVRAIDSKGQLQIAELIRPQPAGSRSGLHTIIADVEKPVDSLRPQRVSPCSASRYSGHTSLISHVPSNPDRAARNTNRPTKATCLTEHQRRFAQVVGQQACAERPSSARICLSTAR